MRSVWIGRQRVVRMMLVPAVWVLGLIGSFVGQAFHEAAWLADHPAGAATEMDILSLGDYPNVFAGWVILGWVPVLIGLLLSSGRTDLNSRVKLV